MKYGENNERVFMDYEGCVLKFLVSIICNEIKIKYPFSAFLCVCCLNSLFFFVIFQPTGHTRAEILSDIKH